MEESICVKSSIHNELCHLFIQNLRLGQEIVDLLSSFARCVVMVAAEQYCEGEALEGRHR